MPRLHWFWRATIALIAGVVCGFFSTLPNGGWVWLVGMAVGPLLSSFGIKVDAMFFLGVFYPVLASAGSVLLALIVYGRLTCAFGPQANDNETRCRKCGYILQGLPEPRCPECGERI